MAHAKLEPALARAALEAAHAARVAGDLEVTLVELLRAWSFVRAPLLADAIDIISAEARELRPPVTDESQWLYRAERASDPIEVGVLLTKLPRRPSLLLPGLDALAAGPADPRLAAAAMRRRDVNPWLMGAPSMHRHLDPAYLGAVRALERASPSQARRERIAASVEDLELLTSLRCCELDAGGRRICEALLEASDELPACEDRRELALLAEIAARPHELELRSVYADHMLARGPHAHAEFVVLQLRAEQGELSPQARARMDVLRDDHQRAWLGKLALLLPVDELEWRGGFGDHATARSLVGPSHLEPREEALLGDHPGLRTFTALWGVSEAFMEARASPRVA